MHSCSVLQRVAVCCSMLQCVAVCCSVLQNLIFDDIVIDRRQIIYIVAVCVAVCCSMLQCVLQRVLPCVVVCCRVLPCVAVCCSVAVRCSVRTNLIWYVKTRQIGEPRCMREIFRIQLQCLLQCAVVC